MSWLADILTQKPVNPMATEITPTGHTNGPAPIQNNTSEPATAVIEQAYPRLHTTAPLNGEDLERRLVAKSNHQLQGLAQRVEAVRSPLVELTAAVSAVNPAKDARHIQGEEPKAWLLTLWNRLHLLSAYLLGHGTSLYQRLIDAGLSPVQIALIGAKQAPDLIRQKDLDWIRDRLAEAEPQIAAAQPVGEEVAQ